MENLKQICADVRADVVTTIGTLGVGHIGGSLSIVDLLVVLYEKHMNIDPKNPNGRQRPSDCFKSDTKYSAGAMLAS